ncbi:hypothetical protein BH10BDE1_BH10BDE1_31580 [soil metagenome]
MAIEFTDRISTTAALWAAVFLLSTLSFGCGTKSVTESPRKPPSVASEFGQWRGSGSASRTIVSEKGSKVENWTVNLEVVSRTPGFGRIEVTGAMGVYGGTIAWNKKETRILLPGQRKFVMAPNSYRAFSAILPFPISPGEVEAILFDRDFDARALATRKITCRDVAEKQICSSVDGFSLERTRGYEEVAFEVKTADGGKVKMQLRPIKNKVAERDELWELEPPRGFKVIQQ